MHWFDEKLRVVKKDESLMKVLKIFSTKMPLLRQNSVHLCVGLRLLRNSKTYAFKTLPTVSKNERDAPSLNKTVSSKDVMRLNYDLFNLKNSDNKMLTKIIK